MADGLLSVGLDVGTTTTQLIVSRLRVENRAGSFSVPEFSITEREILYKSPVHETPLLGQELVDGNALERLVAAEYAAAGISRQEVDTAPLHRTIAQLRLWVCMLLAALMLCVAALTWQELSQSNEPAIGQNYSSVTDSTAGEN